MAVVPQGLEAAAGDELRRPWSPCREARQACRQLPGRHGLPLTGCTCRLDCPSGCCARWRLPLPGADDLCDGIREALDWERWLHPSMTFRVDVTGTAPGLNHSHFTALRVKNALVDAQRDLWGERSSINLDDPRSLPAPAPRPRGSPAEPRWQWRQPAPSWLQGRHGAAPLKENLAAGLIRLTGWDGSQPLVDPCCGSGVLLIEAALAALQQAPGVERRFALEGWADFQPELWDREVIAPGNDAGETSPFRAPGD